MPTLVLIYHGMTDAGGHNANLHCLPHRNFVAQLNYLKQREFEVVSWRQLMTQNGARGATRVALTFDDGYRSDLDNARLLKQYGYDALFFVATEYIGQQAYMRREEIRELRALGMGIGSHSHHHTLLAPMSDAQVTQELSQSKQILEDILQEPIEHLSFPGGSYDERVVAIGRRVGYRSFHTSDWGVNSATNFKRGLLRRTSVLNSVDIGQFDALLRLRNYRLRQTMFRAKELTKRMLGEEYYYRFRQGLLNKLR